MRIAKMRIWIFLALAHTKHRLGANCKKKQWFSEQGCGSGPGFQISLDPDPFSAQMEQKKLQKGL